MAQFNSLIVTGGARFLNTIKGTIENSEKVGGHSTPASGNASSDQVVLGNDTRLTNSRTPTSHTHGNIQNGGTLQTNDITIASGDKIVVTDSSDSAKVARTSISFDGSTATKALTQKGTWETFGTSNLALGTTSTTALKGDTKYAGSSSAGGAATSAAKLTNTAKIGDTTTPVYFTANGVPSACTYSLNKTVPANAKFTDTTYESKAAASGGTAVSLCTTGEKYNWNNKADKVAPLPKYDPTTTYHYGDICTYSGNVYYCRYETVTGTWDANKWTLLTTPQQDYLHSIDPVGVGSFSMNRNPDSTIGGNSFAAGTYTIASGRNAHAEGSYTTASGNGSHAEGSNTIANASNCHAEGYATVASVESAHAEGDHTTAGQHAHAEGSYTTADGYSSHAEGRHTIASGLSSHAEGEYTTANHKSQHVFGEYNIQDPSSGYSNTRGNFVEIVGNGTTDNNRSNARTLDWSGNEVLAGGLKINGTQDVPIIYEVTQSQYDIIKQSGKLIHNALYVITDAPNLNPTASDIEYSSGVTVKQKIDSKADTSNTYTKSESFYCPPSHDFANGTTSSNAILWFINTYGKKPMSFGFVIKGLGWFECFITFYSNTQGGGIMILNGTARLWVVTYINGAITLTEKT